MDLGAPFRFVCLLSSFRVAYRRPLILLKHFLCILLPARGWPLLFLCLTWPRQSIGAFYPFGSGWPARAIKRWSFFWFRPFHTLMIVCPASLWKSIDFQPFLHFFRTQKCPAISWRYTLHLKFMTLGNNIFTNEYNASNSWCGHITIARQLTKGLKFGSKLEAVGPKWPAVCACHEQHRCYCLLVQLC